MKVLILSNTAGQGHRATADALTEGFDEIGIESRVVDTYEALSPPLYEIVARGYLLATGLVPRAYGRFYRLAELNTRRPRPDTRMSFNTANSLLSFKMRKIIGEFGPDVIVCTHVFSAQIVNVMKRRGRLDVPSVGVVTDYTIHPLWPELSHLDYLNIASELLKLQAVKVGIPAAKILPLGIPIQLKFEKKQPKADARRALSLDPDLFTVLLMGGSMGHGNLAGCVRALDRMKRDCQILAVCGSNRKAKARIGAMRTRKKVRCFGFVHNVDVMMDAADCLITKPGGLTTSEAMAKGLPMVLVNPIPGQEDRNAEFLLNNGLAMLVTRTLPIDEALYQLFYYPERLKTMEESIRRVGRPDATRQLCRFVRGLAK